jgi:hypothetical protein
MRAPIDDNHHKGLLAADSTTGEAKPLTSTDVGGDAALNVYQPALFINVAYDYVSVAYPDATTETYTFKSGGSGSNAAQTIENARIAAVNEANAINIT